MKEEQIVRCRVGEVPPSEWKFYLKAFGNETELTGGLKIISSRGFSLPKYQSSQTFCVEVSGCGIMHEVRLATSSQELVSNSNNLIGNPEKNDGRTKDTKGYVSIQQLIDDHFIKDKDVHEVVRYVMACLTIDDQVTIARITNAKEVRWHLTRIILLNESVIMV